MDDLIPGRILVVDDVYKDVADIVRKFREEGYGVIYHEGPADDIGKLSNVRLVILDLDLKGLGPGTDLEWPALVLKRLSEGGNAFYLVAVWSKHVRDGEIPDDRDWLVELKEAYAEQTGRAFPDLFLKPFRKQLEQAELLERIKQWIMEVPHAGLVFEWEMLLNRARDHATSDILDLEGGSLASLVKVLRKEVGEGANRELVQLFNRVLLRYMTTGELIEIGELMNRLEENGDIDPDWYARFHHMQTYYYPGKTERVWTGDIFETGEDDCRKSYAIVITPRCDLAWDKMDRLKLVYAMRVGYQSEVQQSAFEAIEPGMSFTRDDGKGLSGEAKNFLNAVAGLEGARLKDRFYVLRFVRTGEAGFHLVADLHNACSIPLGEVKESWKHKRICRLDSPYIEDLMHRYAALSARVGVPAIPEKVREAEARRLKGG
jgi:hypothetical protein